MSEQPALQNEMYFLRSAPSLPPPPSAHLLLSLFFFCFVTQTR
jgi:hypothetical protein